MGDLWSLSIQVVLIDSSFSIEQHSVINISSLNTTTATEAEAACLYVYCASRFSFVQLTHLPVTQNLLNTLLNAINQRIHKFCPLRKNKSPFLGGTGRILWSVSCDLFVKDAADQRCHHSFFGLTPDGKHLLWHSLLPLPTCASMLLWTLCFDITNRFMAL